MRLIKNKKGIGEDVVYWFIRILMLALALVTVTLIIDAIIDKEVNTHGIEYHLIRNKILKSQNGISYTDFNTGRTYPGIISDFDEKTLERTLLSVPGDFGVKLTLKMQDGTEDIIYYDQETYERYWPLSWSKKYTLLNESDYVLVKGTNENLKPGLLKMNIAFPNKK